MPLVLNAAFAGPKLPTIGNTNISKTIGAPEFRPGRPGGTASLPSAAASGIVMATISRSITTTQKIGRWSMSYESWNHPVWLLLSVLLLLDGAASADELVPAFPDALDAAAVSVEQLDSILDDALILGNGDLNALVHMQTGQLHIKLTKNDVWDARFDAQLDPPLPKFEWIKQLATTSPTDGGRSTILKDGWGHHGDDAYHAHAYPCQRACGTVIFGDGPNGPVWRCIRAGGSLSLFVADRNGEAVMSITGREGASNGYAYSPLETTTDRHRKLRVNLSGSENAQYYVDVMGPAGKVLFKTGWTESPVVSSEQVFDLPSGEEIEAIIVYTWTEDGRRAENRIKSIALEGDDASLSIDLSADALTPPSLPGRLDVRRAVAQVGHRRGDQPSTDIHILAQSNVVLIGSPGAARLEPIGSEDLPQVESGETDGVRWILQEIPGDWDWLGMSFAVALASLKDQTAVAVVSSREAKDPKTAAIELARATLAQDRDEVIRRHQAEWTRFWSASGVDLDDPFLRDAWYRNLYFLRCVTRPGAIAPGLFAGLIHDRPAWHGDYHTNYNIQQTFWSAYVTNHAELAEPYDRLISEYLPRAQWLARQVFDCDGAYFPHVLFAYEPPHPEKCKSPNGRQYIHHVWGFTQGVSGFTVQPLWLHYKYAPDGEFLKDVAYPAVRAVALFQVEFMDGCRRTADGQIVLGPSVSPEHWAWTKDFARNQNGTFDTAMFRYIFRAAIEGATILDCDEGLRARWQKALGQLPDYPTTGGEEPVVVDVLGAPPINYNIAVPAVPVFPADVVTWASAPSERKLFARTIEGCAWNGNNSAIILAVARARLGMPGATDWLRTELKSRSRPNGTLTLNRLGHAINTFGHYTEQFAASMAVSELLLQSVGDTVRLFPAWPRDKPAEFRNLRTQGGFLVSAAISDGDVKQVSITSTVGGRLRLQSPWQEIAVVQRGRSRALVPDEYGVVVVETRPDDRLVFQQGRRDAG